MISTLQRSSLCFWTPPVFIHHSRIQEEKVLQENEENICSWEQKNEAAKQFFLNICWTNWRDGRTKFSLWLESTRWDWNTRSVLWDRKETKPATAHCFIFICEIMISHFVDGSISRQLLVGLGGADVWGECGCVWGRRSCWWCWVESDGGATLRVRVGWTSSLISRPVCECTNAPRY